MSSTTILIIDDSAAFRHLVRDALERDAGFRSYCIREASDGIHGARLALELLPDLVILDIGLPGLHGIAVARQILSVEARLRILFLSHESSQDVVQEALSTGAKGYLVKVDAGRELMAAVRTVLLGGAYVSNRLDEFDFSVFSKRTL